MIALAPIWWAIGRYWLDAVSFLSQILLNIFSMNGVGYKIEARGFEIVAGMIRGGVNPIVFNIPSSFILLGGAITTALVAASPLEARQFAKSLPLATAIIFLCHVFMLAIAVKCPFALATYGISPDEMRYLMLMRPTIRTIAAYLNIFNQTIGWQFFPLLTWAAVCRKRWL